MEIHVTTRSRLLPDPEYDPISALFFVFSSDENCDQVCRKTGEPTQNGSCIIEGKLHLKFISLIVKLVETL